MEKIKRPRKGTKTGGFQFEEARRLRSMGYSTKVDALPQEARDHIHLLFKKGIADIAIAREINRRFNLKETFEFGELSNHAIANYRKRWEAGEYKKEAAKEVLFSVNSDVIEQWKKGAKELEVGKNLAKTIKYCLKLLNRIKKSRLNSGIVTSNDLRILQLTIDSLFRYLDKGQEMGLLPKTIEDGNNVLKDGQFSFVGDPETLNAILNLLKGRKQRLEYEKTRKKNE